MLKRVSSVKQIGGVGMCAPWKKIKEEKFLIIMELVLFLSAVELKILKDGWSCIALKGGLVRKR
jgi:hypothetical protein